jgi:hypothetical protein
MPLLHWHTDRETWLSPSGMGVPAVRGKRSPARQVGIGEEAAPTTFEQRRTPARAPLDRRRQELAIVVRPCSGVDIVLAG